MEENFKVGMRETGYMGQRRTQKLKTIAVRAKKKSHRFTKKKTLYLNGKQSETIYLQQITNISH